MGATNGYEEICKDAPRDEASPASEEQDSVRIRYIKLVNSSKGALQFTFHMQGTNYGNGWSMGDSVILSPGDYRLFGRALSIFVVTQDNLFLLYDHTKPDTYLDPSTLNLSSSSTIRTNIWLEETHCNVYGIRITVTTVPPDTR